MRTDGRTDRYDELGKMVFTSQTQLLFVLNVLFGQHVSTRYRVIIRPYIKIQILDFYSKCVTGSQTLTCFVLIYVMFINAMFLLHWWRIKCF